MGDTGNLENLLRDINNASVFQITFILAVALLLTIATQHLIPWVANKLSGRHRLYILATVPALRLIIIAATVILIVTRVIKPTFENLVALLGATGLALGFAFKDYVSSLVAGVISLYEMPYRPGDWIKVEEAYGEVKSINMRAVEIVTPDDTLVVVPHLKLWSNLIYNANNGTRQLQVVADFYLHPAHDAEPAVRALRDVALTSPFLQIEQPVDVIVSEKVWGTHYRLKAYPVDPNDQFHFLTDLTVRGKTALMALDVQFVTAPLSPQTST